MKFQIAKSVAKIGNALSVQPSISLFNRLEALPSGPDLNAGLQAAMADPLWLLGRQWQFNEFQGEDAGTPVISSFSVTGTAVSTLYPGVDPATAPEIALTPDSPPVEALVECEPAMARHPRLNAEAGLHLQRMIAHSGPASLLSALAQNFSLELDVPEDPDSDSAGLLWHVVLNQRGLNAAAIALALQAARDAAGNVTALPPGVALAAPDEPAALQLLTRWMNWLDDLVLEGPAINANWQRDRMEYAFSMASFGATPLALRAEEYTDGRLDWNTFTVAPLQRQPQTPPPAIPPVVIDRRHPTAVRYPGMPADRYWEFEDSRVNFAAVEAGPTDLTRMMIAEFALAFGNDWFVVPVELSVGAQYRVENFRVVDSFGIEAPIPSSHNSDGTVWRMYELTAEPGTPGTMTDLVFVPPVADRALESAPLEELLLTRDEMANLAWGIERRVQGTSGESINRNLEAARLSMQQQLTLTVDDPQLIYRLATHVPAHWIPLLPVRKVRPDAAVTEIWLRRAGLKRFYPLPEPLPIQPADDAAMIAYKEFLQRLDVSQSFVQKTSTAQNIGVYLFHPRGYLLRADETKPIDDTDTLILREEEVPRTGALVKRSFQYARTPNGRSYLWIGRAKHAGQGEASSGLKFDTAALWQSIAAF